MRLTSGGCHPRSAGGGLRATWSRRRFGNPRHGCRASIELEANLCCAAQWRAGRVGWFQDRCQPAGV